MNTNLSPIIHHITNNAAEISAWLKQPEIRAEFEEWKKLRNKGE